MTKTLNIRYLVRLILILGILGGIIHFVHRAQASKLPALYLEQAKKAEEERNYSKMIELYGHYLKLRPGDLETKKKLVIHLAKHSRTAQGTLNAIERCEQILRQDPEDDMIRRELIRLAIRIEDYSKARGHIEELQKKDKNKADGDLWDLLGQCYLGERKFEEARKNWLLAIEKKPTLVETYARLANLLRKEFRDPSQADLQIEQMIQAIPDRDQASSGKDSANPDKIKAHLIRMGYGQEYGDETKVEDSLGKALNLAAENHDPQVLLAASLVYLDKAEKASRNKQIQKAKDLGEDALKYLREGVEKNDPPEVENTDSVKTWEEKLLKREIILRLYRNLINQERRSNRLKEGEEWARKGMEKFPDQIELVNSLIEILLQESKFDEAKAILEKNEIIKNRPIYIDYYRARMDLAKEQWPEALEQFQKVIKSPDLVQNSGLALLANFFLAQCYDRIGDQEGSLEAYQRAIPSDPYDPLWGQAMMGKARALEELGRREEAISTYDKAKDTVPSAIPFLIRSRIAETLSQSQKTRDWKRTDVLVSQLTENPAKELLQYDISLMKDDLAGAKKILEQAKKKYPKDIQLAVAFALHPLTEKDTATAEKLLKEVEKEFSGDSVTIRIARSRLIPTASGPEGLKQLAQLGTKTDQFFSDERKTLFTALVNRAKALGDKELAGKFLDQLIAENPDRIPLLFERFDLALSANDPSTMRNIIDKIEKATKGKNPSNQLAKAFFLIWEAKQTKDPSNPKLREAEIILTALENQRPTWSRIPFALGMVYDAQQKHDLATNKYQQAVDLGDRNPDVLVRLAEAYFASKQSERAQEMIRLLPKEQLDREKLQFIRANLSLQSGDLNEAERLARKHVAENNQDVTKQLWLAQVLSRNNKKDEAEKVIRRAIELGKDRVEPRLTLIEYYLQTNKKSQAETELQNAVKEVKKEDLAFLQAKSFEMMNKFDEASRWYITAIQERPNEIFLLRNAIDFFLPRDVRRAEELGKRLLGLSKSDSDREFAEKRLMHIASIESNPDKLKELLKVMNVSYSLTPNESLTKLSTSDLKKQALARTALRGRKAREEAIRMYRELESRNQLQEADRAIMAQLYFRLGNREETARQLSILIASQPKNVNYLLSSLQLAFDEEEISTVRARLKQLEAIDPSSFRVVEWKARFLHKEKKTDECKQILEAYAKQKPEATPLIAAIFDSLELPGDAERLFLEYAKDPKKPEGGLYLATFYAQHNRKQEVLRYLTTEPSKYPFNDYANTALVALHALENVDKNEIEEVKKAIHSAAPKGADLKLIDAALHNRKEEYSQAITLYGEISPKDPRYYLMLNNLAFLVAYHQKNLNEALRLIEISLSQKVPDPTSLDTKAMILLLKNEPNDTKEAIQIFEDSIVDNPKATTYYHLARAYWMMAQHLEKMVQDAARDMEAEKDLTKKAVIRKKKEGIESEKDEAMKKAKDAMTQAEKRKLKLTDLHALERAEYKLFKSNLL